MQIACHSADDLAQLRDKIRHETHATQRDRYRVVILALEGLSAPAMMDKLGRSRHFVQRWAYAYRDGGLNALWPTRQSGRPPTLPRDKEQPFRERMRAGPTTSEKVCTLRAEEARRILEKEFGVQYTLGGVYDLLHRLGLSCLKPRPRHRKNDPEIMQKWLQEAPPFIHSVQQKHPDKNLQVWFQDEARIGQQGTLTTVWAEKGSRPTAVKQTEYDWIYLFGAVNPLTGDSSGLLAPTVNTGYMNHHLRFISEQAGPDVHVILVLDQAGWHTAKDLQLPENITLFYLPAYSPELNPIERLWAYLKSHYLSNRVYLHYDELLNVSAQAWNCITPERFRSICHAQWIPPQN